MPGLGGGEFISSLYIQENGAVVGLQNGRIAVTLNGSVVKSIPAETIENIVILGKSQLTTQCVEYCLSKGKGVSYLSKGGRYYGRLQSERHVNVFRQRNVSSASSMIQNLVFCLPGM